MNQATHAVFLSYASQDAEAARRLAEALRAAGVEVWFDQNEFQGGDAWDAKIRRQIAECALFVPVISAATQARREGYFRLEWKLAAQRTHMMSARSAFLLPVVIDDTRDAAADVPDEFKAVQWTRLPGGEGADKFCSRVAILLGRVSESAGPGSAPVPGAAPGFPPAASAHRAKRRRLLFAGLILGGVALGVGLIFWLRPPSAPASASPAATAPAEDPKSIAVLPFANLSSEKDSEYFSDGLSEEILDQLARRSDLRVVARSSSFYYKGKNVPIPQIGRELKVSHIIDGSVRRSGNRVRITAQLILSHDGAQLWSESFERELTDVFALQSEVARSLTNRLGLGGVTSPAPALTSNPEAYDAYLRGRYLQSRSSRGAEDSIPFFQQAVTLDPSFAQAWTQLGNAQSRYIGASVDRSPERIARTREAYSRARALQPDLPETLIALARLAVLLDRNLPLADTLLKRAAQLGPPSSALRQVQSQLARARNDHATWRRLLGEALLLDPQNGDLIGNAALLFGELGDYAEGDRLSRRAVVLAGSGSVNAFVQLLENRLRWRGPEAAWRLLENAAPDQSGWQLRKGSLLVRLGRLEEAHEAFARGLAGELDAMRYNASWAGKGWFEAAASGLDVRERAKNAYEDALNRYSAGDRAILVRAQLAQTTLVLDRRQEARAYLDAWWKEVEASGFDDWELRLHLRYLAPFYAYLGDADSAMLLLARWRAAGAQPGHEISGDVRYKPIMADARFTEFVRQCESYAAAQPDPVDP